MLPECGLPDLRSFTFEELERFILSNGEARFRAEQLFSWLHKPVRSFDEMTNLSLSLREKLKRIGRVSSVDILQKYVSKKDGTIKYLFMLQDGECVESVVMRYRHGVIICISSQAGCRMGCRFCASTIGGLSRNLTAGEMLCQVIFAQQDLGERISGIVIMGIGEPLDNFENVAAFLVNVGDSRGINIGYRHIALSTCGIADKIEQLSRLNLPITLSVSLHAPNDDIRNALMPINRRYPLARLLDACKRYQAVTGRRITFEYTLIDNVNDSEACAKELAALLGGMLCHVNLIGVNEVVERGFVKSSPEKTKKFMKILQSKGIPTTLRRELGSDISASCGQLRQKRL